MKALRPLALALLAFAGGACRAPETAGPPPLALFDGGRIEARDLNAWLLDRSPAERRPAEGESAAAWVTRSVRRMFVEIALLDQVGPAGADESSSRERLEGAVRAAQGRAFLERKNARFEVSETEIQALFERELEAYALPERRSFRNLLVAAEPSGAPEGLNRARAFAEELRRRLAAGESFEELARAHSASANAGVGGLVGAVDRSRLRGEVGELVFSLAIGELSPVVCHKAGCMLFEVSQILPAIRPELALHRARLAERIAGERRRAWWSALLVAEGASQGATLPAWIADAAAPPLTPDVEVARLGGRTILGRDLEARDAGVDPVDRLRSIATELLLSAALERDAPEEAARVRARVERDFAFDSVLRKRIAERALAVSEEPLRSTYEARKESYRSDLELELTVYSRPIGAGDPVEQAAELARFAVELRAAGAGAERQPSLAEAGIERERLPRRSARHLARTRPDLAVALLGEISEDRVAGPYRFASRLYVVRFDVVIPERTLSYLEARDRVRDDYLARESGRIFDDIVDELARERRLRIDAEAARRFGESMLAPAAVTPRSDGV